MAYGGRADTDPYDAIRAMVGDTDASDEKLDDGMVALAYRTGTDLYSRAAVAADILHGKYVNEVTVRVGDVWYEGKVVANNYAKMAADFRLQGRVRGGGRPFLGGHNLDDAQSRREDTSISQPNITVGMMDSVDVNSQQNAWDVE